jgi:hypothetical protein
MSSFIGRLHDATGRSHSPTIHTLNFDETDILIVAGRTCHQTRPGVSASVINFAIRILTSQGNQPFN